MLRFKSHVALKSKFPDFDFTTIGRWDYWKR